MVVLGRDEHLAFARQPAPRARVLHAVEVALEAEPVRVGVLADPPVPGADRAGRPRRQHCGEVGLPLLAPAEPAADEGIGIPVGTLHGDALLDDHRFHVSPIFAVASSGFAATVGKAAVAARGYRGGVTVTPMRRGRPAPTGGGRGGGRAGGGGHGPAAKKTRPRPGRTSPERATPLGPPRL